MARTNGQKLREILFKVSEQDGVNSGVAKARFAGEAEYSVPSLERLMRGEEASKEQREGTLWAAKARGFKVKEAELFPSGEADGEEEAS